MMSYLLIGIIAAMAYYMRKYYLRVINQIHLCNEDKLKEMRKEIEEKNKIIKQQEYILFYISDGMDNLGGRKKFLNKNIEKKYFDDLGRFFMFNKHLSDNLVTRNFYTQEEYEEILNFIKEDLHDYLNHESKELDLQISNISW